MGHRCNTSSFLVIGNDYRSSSLHNLFLCLFGACTEVLSQNSISIKTIVTHLQNQPSIVSFKLTGSYSPMVLQPKLRLNVVSWLKV